MTVVEANIQDLDSIDDEDILRRMLFQVDDFAEKKRIRARISKVKEKRLKEFYASDEVTGSTESASFSASSKIQCQENTLTESVTNISSAASFTSRLADSRKRSSQENLEELHVDEKMRKCEEIIAERIRKKSQERGKRLQQIKSEMEKNENLSVSSLSSASHIEVSINRPDVVNGETIEKAAEKLQKADEELQPLAEGLQSASGKLKALEEKLKQATPKKAESDRTEILVKPKAKIIRDPSQLGIVVEPEIEIKEQTIESKKAFRCSPDSSLDRDSPDPPVRLSRYSPYNAPITRNSTLDEIESVVLDSMEVIETVAEPKKISPLIDPEVGTDSKKEETQPRKISSQDRARKQEGPVRKSSLKGTKSSMEELRTNAIRRDELQLELRSEPVIEDVSQATTPYLAAHKQSTEYLVSSPEPAKPNRRYSEVEIEDVTDSSFDEADFAEGPVGIVAEPASTLSVIDEKPKKRSPSPKKKTSIPTASSDRAGSPGRRCCRRGTTPDAPLTAAEKREKLIARKISVTDEEFEMMEKEILEQEKREKTKTAPQRKTKSPEKPEIEPKRVRKISPSDNKPRAAITSMLKPARRTDSKENALKTLTTERKSAVKQLDKTFTKKPSEERVLSSTKSPTKSRIAPLSTKATPKTTRGLYSPKSSKELPVAIKSVKLDDEAAENVATAPAKIVADPNGKKKLQSLAENGSSAARPRSGSSDTPKNALSPVASRESTPKADESSRKTKTKDESRRTSRDENSKKEYKRQDSAKLNGERKNFELIDDLELLERLLETAKEYDERSRIRARIRLLKKPVSGIPTLSTSSPRASPLLGRRVMPQVEKKATTPTPTRKVEAQKKPETPKLKKDTKPVFRSTDEIIKSVTKEPEVETEAVEEPEKQLIDHPFEKIPEQPPAVPATPQRPSSPVIHSSRRVSEIRQDEAPTPLERTPSFRRSPSPVISATAVIYRPQTVLQEPEPVPKSSPPMVRRKSAIKLEMKPDSTTVINEPVSTNLVTTSVIEVVPNDQLKSDNESLSAVSRTPNEKSNKVARSLTSQLSFSQGRLPENDPSQPQGPDETRVITSSYGVGPTDDTGRPLFGLGALRKARNKTPEAETPPSVMPTTEKREPGPLDSNGRPLFGLGALKAQRSSVDESSGNQVSRSVLDIIKSHEREGPLADRPDVIPDRPRARKRDSFIQDEEPQPTEVKEPIVERSPNLKGIIKQHEEVSRSFVDFKVDLSRPSGPALVIGRSQPLSQVISQHEQAILEDKKVPEPALPKMEIEKSLPVSDAIRKHEKAIVEDKVISTSKTAVELEKSIAVQEAVNLHKSAIEMDGKIFVPKRNVEVEKTQSIREIIDIHKQKQEEEIPAPVDVRDVSSPRPRRKLRDTFINDPSADQSSSATSAPIRRPGILKKPKESTVSQPDPVAEISSQPDPYATLERVEIVRNSVSEKRVSIDNTVVVNGHNAVPTEESVPWRRRSASSSPSRTVGEPVVIETSRVEVKTEVLQPCYEDVPSWRSRPAQRVEEPTRKPSVEQTRKPSEPAIEPAWRKPSEPVIEPSWRKPSESGEPAWRRPHTEPEKQGTTLKQEGENVTDTAPSWRSKDKSPERKLVSEPAWRRPTESEPEEKKATEPAWRKVSEQVEVMLVQQSPWRQDAEPEKLVTEPACMKSEEPENVPAWRRSPDVTRKQSREPVEQKKSSQEPTWRSRFQAVPEPPKDPSFRLGSPEKLLTADDSSRVTVQLTTTAPVSVSTVRIPEPVVPAATVAPEPVVPAPVVSSFAETAVSSSRYSREETRRFSVEQRFKEFGSSEIQNEHESTPDRELSPARSVTPAELRQASIAKTEHRNSVTERWQPKQPVSAAQSMTLDRTSRQTTPERTDNGMPKGRMAGISSVKGLAQKFMQAVEDNGSPPSKQTKNYPKAGLIFRSSSFKQNQGLSPSDQDGSPLRRTGSLRTESSPSWRRASKENTDPNYDDSPPWRRKRSTESLNRDENPPVMRDTTSPAPKSFLEDHSKVTGVSDILDRMRAGNVVSSDDGPKTDEEARSLLNKFIGAQIILQGIEPVLQSSNGISQSNGHLQSSLISSQTTTKSEKQRHQRTSVDIKIPSMGESFIVNGIDILSCDDHFKLNELLDSSNDYETRQKLKTRIRDLLAAEKQGIVVDSNCTPALSVSHTSAFESTNQDLATPDEKDFVKLWLSENFPSGDKLTNNGTVTGFQKSVTASQSTNATMVQQNQGMIKKSTLSSSSFRSQSQTSSVTVNPGGSAFSKFQQLDRANSASSPKTPSSAVTGPTFSFGAPANKIGIVTVKDAILQWCQGRTRGYKNVQITDFSTSWTDGLAFCALIHHFYPDAFDFDSLDPKNRRFNLELAFRTADEKAGIAPLLDVEDMISMRKPDWKCVFTYIQTFYRRLKDE